MKSTTMRQAFSRGVLLSWLAVMCLCACNPTKPTENPEPATKPALTSQPSLLAQQMIGTWVHVGRPGNVHEIPAEGGRLKFRTGKHWTLVTADPNGEVIEQFGGTYTLNGDEYIETQDYGDARWMKDNGKSFKFKVKVEGDTMTQIGVDNLYTEVWKLAK